jgi:regulator of protease activity HflC (stomatin/prohibitin superfamily)
MTGITWLVFLVIGLIVLVIGSIIKKREVVKDRSTRSDETLFAALSCKRVGVCMVVLFGFLFMTRFLKVIDAGEVGVQVLFGQVLDKQLTEGINVKNPFASVDIYNIQLRETTMDVADKNALQALTSDKLAVNIDATIWWKIIAHDAGMIRRTISSDETVVDDVVVFPAVRSAVRDAVVLYTFDEIITKRGELSAKIDEILINLTEGKGSDIQKVLIRNVSPEDARVTNSIGEKLQQQQQLQAKQYELKKAEMDAQIRIKTAEGISTAQNIIQKTLTPEYLQFERIQMMKTLAGAPNTTFIFDDGGSVPMVFNKDIDKK